MANKHYHLALALALGLSALSVPGHAEEAAAPAAPLVIGSTTENMLDMQREGRFAGNAQPIPGEVASLSYRRYQDSFAKPMPEFKETVGTSVKSGSGNTK